MKNLFLTLIILGVGYMVSIFLAPTFADSVGNIFGLKQFNEKIRNNGGDFNRIFTNIPTKEEFKKGYEDVLKKAEEYSDDFSDGVDKTKEKIDELRVTLSGAEDKINKAKETYENLKDTYETVNKKLDDAKNSLDNVEKIGEAITSVVNTGAISEVTNTGGIQ